MKRTNLPRDKRPWRPTLALRRETIRALRTDELQNVQAAGTCLWSRLSAKHD